MTDHSQYAQTLNELMARKESQREEGDVLKIIEGLRKQRELWNAREATGSRKLIQSNKITAGDGFSLPPKKKVSDKKEVTQPIDGLKLKKLKL